MIFASASALANDTAFYSIPVKGIDPTTSKVGGEIVKFYGKEAGDFMKLLPPVLTVPPYDKIVAKHQKTLNLKSNAYTLNFSCIDAEIADDGDAPQAKPLPEGTRCVISLYNNDFEDGDTMNFRQDGGKTAVIRQLQQ